MTVVSRELVHEHLDNSLERLVLHRRESVVEHDPGRSPEDDSGEGERHLLVFPELAIPALLRVETRCVSPEAGAFERVQVIAVGEAVGHERVGEHFA